MRKALPFMFAFLLFLNSAYSAGNNTNGTLNVSDIPKIQKEALKKYKDIKTQNKYQEQMRQAAEKANQMYNQQKMQTMINTYKNDIFSSKQFTSAFKKYVPQDQLEAINRMVGNNELSRLSDHNRLFIFISSSMPASEIRSYVRQVAELNDPDVQIVMRGFIGGVKYMKPTVKFYYNMIKKDPSCDNIAECEVYNVTFDVNPLPFRKYHVDRVPAFVFDPNFQEINESTINLPDSAYKLYGDVSLEYALEKFYEKSRYAKLKELLNKLNNKGFFAK